MGLANVFNFNDESSIDCEIQINISFRNLFHLSKCLWDLQLIVSHFYEIIHADTEPTHLQNSPRSLGDRFADAMVLRSFKDGSFIGTVAASVTAALILKFIERHFCSSSKKTTSQTIIKVINIEIKNTETAKSINEILSGISSFDNNNLEQGVNEMVVKMAKKGLAPRSINNGKAADRAMRSLKSRIKTLNKELGKSDYGK